MRILVTSAGGTNGNGYGALLTFASDGESLGPFSSDPRITDPRGMAVDLSGDLIYLNSGDDRILALDQDGTVVLDSEPIPGLDPGGAVFGPDGRYYVTMRGRRTVGVLPAELDDDVEGYLPDNIVPFPRGCAFGPDGRLYLASGAPPSAEPPSAEPRAGGADNTILVFDRAGTLVTPRLVTDPELSPLDLTIAPDGNIVVASEHPFGAPDAVTSVREYDPVTGQLVRVLRAEPATRFRRPRGLRFGPAGRLYCVAEDIVAAFDFAAGTYAGPVVELTRLNGQAVVLIP
jgi:DNA-binding beta-propeller fold protein YncE